MTIGLETARRRIRAVIAVLDEDLAAMMTCFERPSPV
jgi:hypothetical protein